MEPKTRVAKVINKADKTTTVRHGTVERVDGDTVQVLIDNTASPITCARACVCVQGDRVVVVGKDAIATVGANYGSGGSGNIAATSYVLKGDNQGNAIAATPGTDYTIPAAGLPTGGTSGQVLAKNSSTNYDVAWINQSGGGGISYTDFLAEQVTVIDGASVTNGGYSENTKTVNKAGYYPLGVVGWTSANRYPNVYGCRLTAQSVGSASVFCGASNFTGSTRTLTVTATVLWVKVS